ncbi:MAG: RNA polymerase sigma factor region1.1 domain-containing protein, partial [Eubacterium sp.]|nr:RNA polymerase sigma factor region1.1 domain-containing protein [Eubacterium sp.]
MANMEENRKKMKKKDQAAEAEHAENAVFDQQKFLEILGTLVERAKKKKNMLEYQEISDFFSDMNLDAER